MNEHWDKLKAPPVSALKKIEAGRLSGKTDINPQWRYEAMTSVYGECGIGWKYQIVRLWLEPATDGQMFAFAEVNVYTKQGEAWSEAIPGIGGSMLIQKETKGLHSNDEAFKMAVTDALSVALKMLGVASDIYRGFWKDSKYSRPAESKTTESDSASPESRKALWGTLEKWLEEVSLSDEKENETIILKFIPDIRKAKFTAAQIKIWDAPSSKPLLYKIAGEYLQQQGEDIPSALLAAMPKTPTQEALDNPEGVNT